MAFKYESVVPWGRSYQEYIEMFGLTEDDLDKRILGCGDGPASFNSEMNRRGKRVISIDPLYRLSGTEIKKRIDETFKTVVSQTRLNMDKFIWTRIKDADDLGNIRMKAMNEFLNDYEKGSSEGRYIAAELPVLPFDDDSFDLSLSSHFLFLHADHLSTDFHIESICEMLRVSREVRIFPLLDVNSFRPAQVDRVIDHFEKTSYSVEEINVGYEFQKGANRALTIRRP